MERDGENREVMWRKRERWREQGGNVEGEIERTGYVEEDGER